MVMEMTTKFTGCGWLQPWRARGGCIFVEPMSCENGRVPHDQESSDYKWVVWLFLYCNRMGLGILCIEN